MMDKARTGICLCCLGVAGYISAQGYPSGEAAQRMTVAEGFEVKLVAAEPLIRKPVAVEFDDRGRLWVLQYLQYPNPAGLKRVTVDRYSRTIYDRTPSRRRTGPRVQTGSRFSKRSIARVGPIRRRILSAG